MAARHLIRTGELHGHRCARASSAHAGTTLLGRSIDLGATLISRSKSGVGTPRMLFSGLVSESAKALVVQLVLSAPGWCRCSSSETNGALCEGSVTKTSSSKPGHARLLAALIESCYIILEQNRDLGHARCVKRTQEAIDENWSWTWYLPLNGRAGEGRAVPRSSGREKPRKNERYRGSLPTANSDKDPPSPDSTVRARLECEGRTLHWLGIAAR
ncbi:hypothetical protein N657DRAFT_326471 [Parathielavia appendiculata]|uniref:Uncharacterized protein n=1 Tax=Parathielavia appendiculata TaxID=2587402 RepID=A0AAN6YYH9_9PEZI|nr:hypothetical protein N657DRAFT_326471 [Parathielavia appendiculata]